MLYSEASYFDGYHFQHIADWKEHLRLTRKLLDASKSHLAYLRGNRAYEKLQAKAKVG